LLNRATNHTPNVGNNLKKLLYIQVSLIFILLFILLFPRGQNSAEKELNGVWREVKNEFMTWHFYPDGLVIKIPSYPNGIYEITEWSANKSKIEFEFREFGLDSLGNKIDTINKVLINYKLSDKKDSLFGTLKNNYGEYKFSLLKTKSYIEYLKKKFGIEFTLPKKDSSSKYLNRNKFSKNPNSYNLYPIYGMRIFMGISNSKVIGKTEISDNLNNLESDIKTFKARIEPSQHPLNYYREILDDEHINLLDNRFHFRVFADKNISDEMITKYLSININGDSSFYKRIQMKTPDLIPIKIFRIYDNKEMEKNTGIRGKEIKTIANTVYN
jgi:hypothetical protein